MKIEAGKFYRTRGGLKARVYATDGVGDHPNHGAVNLALGWVCCRWRGDGAFDTHNLGDEHDLVAEWTDLPVVNWSAMPAWAQWVAMDKDGEWLWYQEEPLLDNEEWGLRSGRLGAIPEPYTPTYTGDWKQSLVKRPC